jgi:hypothetical protein
MLVEAMNKMILDVTIDNDRPSMIIMDSNYYMMYASTLQTIQRIVEAKAGDAGFRTIEFQGIPVMYEPHCPADHAYFVNDTYLHPVVLNGREFAVLEPRKAYNQLARLYIMHFVGNLILKNAQRQGVIFTAATGGTGTKKSEDVVTKKAA